MKAHHRWSRILEIIAETGYIDVEEASQHLGVSVATIRRDLDRLAEQQLLTRTHGGAVSTSTVAYDLPLRYNAERNVTEKVRIAAAVAERVPLGSIVALTGGTTTTECARALAMRADTANSPLTLVTNAINIANELTLRSGIQLVVLGGVVRAQSYELTGRLATRVLDEISIDTAVVSGNAFNLTSGLTCHSEAEAGVAAEITRRATTVIVAVDSSKLEAQTLARVCGVDQVDLLVTDTAAPRSFVEQATERGLDVLQA